MPRAVRKMMENGFSIDETDRMPDNIHVSRLDIVMYVWAIISHFIDLGLDLNVAVRYCLGGLLPEFLWTLSFILFPAFINTAISVRMYALDKSEEESVSNTFSKVKVLRIFVLVFQMAPILRFTDALIYALKSRRAEQRRSPGAQRKYYKLMLKEDSDAALLRVVECFLEAAPQQVLQLTLLYRGMESYTLHQALSIGSSVVSQAWCLAAYQRAIRFAQEDAANMSWLGSALQVLWHFFVTLSRIMAISAVAYVFSNWAIVAICVHVVAMVVWLQFFDNSPFCAHSRFAQFGFSIVMGFVYVFTYIIPVEGRTRYRYAVYYTLCLVENVACAVLWYLSPVYDYFYVVLILSVAPFFVGIIFMVLYYAFFHPKVKLGRKEGFTVTIKTVSANEDS